ncbi:hypothetical protein ACWGLL_12080 [Brevundimonas sp. NPDC055814]
MPVEKVNGKTVLETAAFVMTGDTPTATLMVRGIPLEVIVDSSIPYGETRTAVKERNFELRTGALSGAQNAWASTRLLLDGIDHEIFVIFTQVGQDRMKAYHVTYTITA